MGAPDICSECGRMADYEGGDAPGVTMICEDRVGSRASVGPAEVYVDRPGVSVYASEYVERADYEPMLELFRQPVHGAQSKQEGDECDGCDFGPCDDQVQLAECLEHNIEQRKAQQRKAIAAEARVAALEGDRRNIKEGLKHAQDQRDALRKVARKAERERDQLLEDAEAAERRSRELKAQLAESADDCDECEHAEKYEAVVKELDQVCGWFKAASRQSLKMEQERDELRRKLEGQEKRVGVSEPLSGSEELPGCCVDCSFMTGRPPCVMDEHCPKLNQWEKRNEVKDEGPEEMRERVRPTARPTEQGDLQDVPGQDHEEAGAVGEAGTRGQQVGSALERARDHAREVEHGWSDGTGWTHLGQCLSAILEHLEGEQDSKRHYLRHIGDDIEALEIAVGQHAGVLGDIKARLDAVDKRRADARECRGREWLSLAVDALCGIDESEGE